MRIDVANTPYKIASDVAKKIKTLRITPHGITKFSLCKVHKSRKPNTPLSIVTTTSSPNNLNWQNAKHACLDRKTSLSHSCQQKSFTICNNGRRMKFH